MKIEYHIYKINRSEIDANKFFIDDPDKENWVLVDKSDKEKIVIHSGKRIDNLLIERGISYDYCGLKSYEVDDRKISIVSS